jgi:photosystem II stability/assembly factor-like uncharacterized protein
MSYQEVLCALLAYRTVAWRREPYLISRKLKQLVCLIIGLLAVTPVASTYAHSPQHVIDSLEISPSFSHDQTLFIIVQNYFLRSTDGGYEWKELVNGLDNKYIFSSVAISPFYRRDGLVYVSSDGSGIYRSRDGGGSWQAVNEGLGTGRVGILCMSPGYEDGAVVLAAGVEGGLYRALLTEVAWRPVIEEAVKVTALGFSPDPVSEIVVAGDDQGNIWVSEDGGKTWRIRYRMEELGRITAVGVSDQFSHDRTFFIGTEREGLFRTVDGGETFDVLKGGPSEESFHCAEKRRRSASGKHVMSIALAPNYGKSRTVYATTWYDAVYKSDDGGETWERLGQGLSCDRQADTYNVPVPHFRELKLSENLESDGTLFLAGFDGLFKSVSRGKEWRQLEPLPVRLIRGLGISPSTNDNYVIGITTYGGGAYKSSDRGRTWAVLNLGLKTTRLSDIAYSPAYWTDNTVFSASLQRFLISKNSGSRWRYVKLEYKGWRKYPAMILKKFLGVPKRYLLSKRQRSAVWPMAIAISPEFAKDRTIFIGTRRQGVMKSKDGGRSWSDSWQGTPVGFILSLAISPNFRLDQTLFAAVRGHGIYKSMDGGASWRSRNKGFQFLRDVNMPAAPNYNADPVLFSSLKEVYVEISPNYQNDGTVFAMSGEGLFKTTNGGTSWKLLDTRAEVTSGKIEALALSPNYAQDQTIIVSVKGKGLFLSVDGGRTFEHIGSDLIEGNHNIKWIQFSPDYHHDHTVFAASEEQLFVSKDFSGTWITMPRPVRYENWRGEGHGPVRFEGSWTLISDLNYSASSASGSATIGDAAVLDFIGSGVRWIGPKGPMLGVAQVYIDGGLIEEVEQYSLTPAHSVTLFQSPRLDYGHHEISIRIVRGQDSGSINKKVIVDAFDVLP